MKNRRRRGRLVPGMTVLFALLMVACKKDPSPPQAGSAGAMAAPGAVTEPAGQQPLPPCSIVSLQEVQSTLGIEALKASEVQGEWPVRGCAFPGPPLNLPLVTVRFEVGAAAADFAAVRKNHEEHGQPTKDFPGLGDAAAIVDMNGKPIGITCIYKKTLVFITTMHAPIEKQIALARIVLQRM